MSSKPRIAESVVTELLRRKTLAEVIMVLRRPQPADGYCIGCAACEVCLLRMAGEPDLCLRGPM
jgi:hypothetical protein